MTIESTYHLKWISWNSGMIPIVMQSANGPCPLIATMNVLLLKEKIKLPEMLEQITEAQLLAYIGESIMDSVPPPDMQNDENFLLNLEQNIHDAIEILPKLKSGLDVNIRFTGITDFEYTPECIIFDLLRIHLYHGWLTDPESSVLQEAIGNQSYNQLVDSIITNKASSDSAIATKVLVAENFLEGTASQLTVHGLNELKSKILDNEIGILFRNNHFLTLFKRDGEIYTLVTDHGYLTESNIVWETLDSIEGAGVFFDANFQLSELVNRQVQAFKDEQLVNDFLVALSLKEEESESGQVDIDAAERKRQLELKDLEMAKRLQEEEDGQTGHRIAGHDRLGHKISRRDRVLEESWTKSRPSLDSPSTGTNNDQSMALVPCSSNLSSVTPASSLTYKDTQTIQQAATIAETTKSLDTRPQHPSPSDHRTFPKLMDCSARPYEESSAADGNRDGPLPLQRMDSPINSLPSSDCVEVIPQRTFSADMISQDDTNSSDQNQHRQHATQATGSSMAHSPPTYATVVDSTRGSGERNSHYQANSVTAVLTNQQQPRPSSGRNGNRPRGEKSRESSCRVH